MNCELLQFLSTCSCLKNELAKAGAGHLIVLITTLSGINHMTVDQSISLVNRPELLNLLKSSLAPTYNDNRIDVVPILGDMELWQSCRSKASKANRKMLS